MHGAIYYVPQVFYHPDHVFHAIGDIQGHTVNSVNGGSIPANIVPAAEKPDIVCMNNNSKMVSILELSVPFEGNLTKAREYKTNKYSNLVSDIENSGYKCELVCFEVGSQGLISSNNKFQFKEIAKIAKSKAAKGQKSRI